ncbi:hypothetical protein ES703_37724 [subsurface metagenome]
MVDGKCDKICGSYREKIRSAATGNPSSIFLVTLSFPDLSMAGRTNHRKSIGTRYRPPLSLEFLQRFDGKILKGDLRFCHSQRERYQGLEILIRKIDGQHLRAGGYHFGIFKMCIQPIGHSLFTDNVSKIVLVASFFALFRQIWPDGASHSTGLMASEATFLPKDL